MIAYHLANDQHIAGQKLHLLGGICRNPQIWSNV